MRLYTPEKITELGSDEIFVFGSNLDADADAASAANA